MGRARVNQLIRSGMLAAEKVGGIWLIDEQSVEARRNAAPKAGRPPASSSKGDVGRYVLMNRTHEVLSFATMRRPVRSSTQGTSSILREPRWA